MAAKGVKGARLEMIKGNVQASEAELDSLESIREKLRAALGERRKEHVFNQLAAMRPGLKGDFPRQNQCQEPANDNNGGSEYMMSDS